jgi:ABC-type transport system substrate-binding protein
MSRTNTLIALAAALAALTASASAQQTPRHRHTSPVVEQYAKERPPLTVTKRSYLDPGNVAPAGKTTPNYVATGTIFNQTQDQLFARSEFGNELLPRPLEIPARTPPLLEFVTPGFPY